MLEIIERVEILNHSLLQLFTVAIECTSESIYNLLVYDLFFDSILDV